MLVGKAEKIVVALQTLNVNQLASCILRESREGHTITGRWIK